MKKIAVILYCLIFCLESSAQKKVCITIDDVPNSILYNKENFQHKLLNKIDSMHLPVTIFINEARIFNTDSVAKNLSLFNDWIKSRNVSLGNHGFNHAMYSSIGLDSFKTEVIKGETITNELAKKYSKEEKYFRFPYNDLGKDSTQHAQSKAFLDELHLRITPFTVHSEDWMVTELYTYYKEHNMSGDAGRIGNAFIAKTMEYFDYIESITSAKLQKNVAQIYLMHDVLLNADYFDKLVDALQKRGYTFITLDEAMKDLIYASKDYYQKTNGISWVYRWIKDDSERQKLIDKGPHITEFQKEYDSLKK